ncbi:hypothetical protein AB0B57_22385 [Micromonospora sp. NPDC049101]|uniref:hypothetical protein n=1 Tax=Micromonospora sp. NPDC049101 TaxID=3155032 RepID=UPI0033E8B207
MTSGEHPAGGPLITEGDVLTLKPRDYCYGSEPVTFKVTFVPKGANLPGLEWVQLHGMMLHPDGSPWQEKAFLVRVQAVRENPGIRLEPDVRETGMLDG